MGVLGRILPESLTARLGQEGPQRYLFHTGWNLLGKIVSLAVSFFVSIYVIRSLGPSNWGLLSYVVSFTGIFSFIASLGVDSILYVDLIKKPEERDRLLGTAFFLKLAGAAGAFLLVTIISVLSANNFYTTVLLATVAGAFFFQPFNVINLYFQANVRSKPTVILSLILNFLMSASKILFVFLGLSLKYFALLYLIEAVLGAAGYLYIYRQAGLHIFRWRSDLRLSREMLAVSWPLILSSAFAYMYSRIDQVMLKHMLSQEAVGLYDTGVRLAEAWYIFPSIIIGSMFPAIINAQKTSQEQFERRLTKLYAFMAYLSLVFILPISLLSRPIIDLLYGPAFLPAANVLKIYVWAGVSVTLATIMNQVLMSEKLTKISLYINFFGMAVNVAMNILLIPRFGILGAAWATLVSYSAIPLSILFFRQARSHLWLVGRALLWRL